MTNRRSHMMYACILALPTLPPVLPPTLFQNPHLYAICPCPGGGPFPGGIPGGGGPPPPAIMGPAPGCWDCTSGRLLPRTPISDLSLKKYAAQYIAGKRIAIIPQVLHEMADRTSNLLILVCRERYHWLFIPNQPSIHHRHFPPNTLPLSEYSSRAHIPQNTA